MVVFFIMYKMSDVAVAELPGSSQYQPIAEAAADLLAQVVECEDSDYIQNEMRDDAARTIVAVEKTGRVIGACLIYMYDRRENLLIDEIGVLPDCQNNGVGTRMLQAAEFLALSNGRGKITLAPISAYDFYSARGFTLTGTGSDKSFHKNLAPSPK